MVSGLEEIYLLYVLHLVKVIGFNKCVLYKPLKRYFPYLANFNFFSLHLTRHIFLLFRIFHISVLNQVSGILFYLAQKRDK